MNALIKRLPQLRDNYPDPIRQQQAQRLRIVNLAWITLLILVGPLLIWWVISGETIDMATLYAPVSIALALIVEQDLRNARLDRARRLFVLNMFAIALLANFPEYRIDTPFIIMALLPLTAAGVLLSRRGLINVAILLVTVIAVIGVIQISSGMEPSALGPVEDSIGVTILLIAVVTTLNTLMLSAFASTSEYVANQRQYMTNLLSVVSDLSDTLVDIPASEEKLNRAVEQVRNAMELYHVQIFLADQNTGQAVLHAGTGFIGRRLLEEDSFSQPGERSPINEILRQKFWRLITENDPSDQRAGFLPATRSELLLPLRVGNLMPLGVLDLHGTQPDTFSDEVIDILVVISNHLAAALYSRQQSSELKDVLAENTRLVDQLDANQRELSQLNRQLISSSWGGYLAERQDPALSYTWSDNTVRPRRIDTASLNQTLADGQPHLEKNANSDILSVPIRLRGQVLGALEFRRSGDVHWTPASLEMAQAVADRLALSLENARLFEQAQSTAQREQLVGQVMSQLQSTTNLQSLLTEAARQFQQALGATHTQVRLGLSTESIPAQADGDEHAT